MQYPFLTLLEIITVLLTLLIGMTIFYFLVKRWRRETKFLTVLKAITLYQLGSLLIYLIYPFSLFHRILYLGGLKIIRMLIFSVILFFIFYFILKKVLLMDWKKSLLSFLLIILIIFPLLDFFRIIIVQKLWNFSVFAKESVKLKAEMEAYFEKHGFFGFLYYPPVIPLSSLPLGLKVIGVVKGATLSWPIDQIREIILTIKLEGL